MDLIHERCAGMDISNRDAKVCVRTPGERRNTFSKKITVHGAMHHDIQSLCDYLVAEEVTLVVMEATSDYWDSQKLHQMGEPNTSLQQLVG